MFLVSTRNRQANSLGSNPHASARSQCMLCHRSRHISAHDHTMATMNLACLRCLSKLTSVLMLPRLGSRATQLE